MNKLQLELLADKQHEIWAHWMKYLFSVCTEDEEGNMVIPSDKVSRWTRQMNTSYLDLTEDEKESDRNQVMKFRHLVNH